MYWMETSAIVLRIKMLVFVLLLFISGVALAAPETATSTEPETAAVTESVGKLPTLLFLPIIDNTELTDPHDYIAEAINAKYAEKYPTAKFAVIPYQKYAEQLSIIEESDTEGKVLKAAAAVGANFVVSTDLQKIEIKRGMKGILLKKWCSADIPVRITIWDVASGKTVFDGVIREKGKQNSALFLAFGLLCFVSEEATIKNGLEKIGNKMDQELPLLK